MVVAPKKVYSPLVSLGDPAVPARLRGAPSFALAIGLGRVALQLTRPLLLRFAARRRALSL